METGHVDCVPAVTYDMETAFIFCSSVYILNSGNT